MVGLLAGCANEADQEVDLENAHIIDVRSRLHWAFSHIDGARHVQWDCIYLGAQVLGIAEDDSIVLYGENESLVSRAEGSLRNMSYNRVLNAGSMGQAQALLGRSIVQPEQTAPDALEQAIIARCEERFDGLPGL